MSKKPILICSVAAIAGCAWLLFTPSGKSKGSQIFGSIYSGFGKKNTDISSTPGDSISDSPVNTQGVAKSMTGTNMAEHNADFGNGQDSVAVRKESAPAIIYHDNDSYNDNMSGSASGVGTTIVYISDYNGGNVQICRRTLDSAFTCQVSLSGLSGPEKMQVVQNKLYIDNMDKARITACDISDNGSLSNCSSLSVPLASPVHLYYSNQQLYIADFGAKNIANCQLDANGDLVSCASSESMPATLFTSAGYADYNYRTKYTANAINKCPDAYSNNCSTLKDPEINGPLLVNAFKGYIYIANCSVSESPALYPCGSAHNVVYCKLQSDGNFSACQIVTDNLKMPTGIAEFATPAN